MSQRLESALERVLHRTPGPTINPRRAKRFMMFCAVGGTGAIIDIVVTLSLIRAETVHYLLANAAGFILAVSWNFTGNWAWTYQRPEGHLGKQYLSYVGLHGATFGLRAISIAILVAALGVTPSVASIIGLGVAAIANFAGTETIFGGVGDVWFDAVEAGNHAAHVVYGSRLRRYLRATGLYNRLYSTYAWALSKAYTDSSREISVANVSASITTEEPSEIVSVLHTLEKEDAVLEKFAADVTPDDHVLDVGANLGVYSIVAGVQGATVTAVEPHPETVGRLAENLDRNGITADVEQAALGATTEWVKLQCQRDEMGTQRPRVGAEGDIQIQQYRGDDLLSDDAPTVVKIDVEGAEQKVLFGLEDVLEGVRLCYVEAHSDAEAEGLMHWFEEFGFETEILTSGEETHIRAIKGES